MTQIQFDAINQIDDNYVQFKFSDLRHTNIEIVIPISDLLLVRNAISEVLQEVKA